MYVAFPSTGGEHVPQQVSASGPNKLCYIPAIRYSSAGRAGDAALDCEIMRVSDSEMKDWLKTASATFAGGAVAISLIAIPTFIWLPREFDSISTRLDLAIDASAEARDRSGQVLEKLISMEIAIARMDAQRVLPQYFATLESTIRVTALAPDIARNFLQLLPADVLSSLHASDQIGLFLYSNFASQDWIFIERADFSSLESEVQRAIFESFERQNVIFTIE